MGTTWHLAMECRVDCEQCDFERYGKLRIVTAYAKLHKQAEPDHTVIVWREQWREVEE